MTGTLHILEHIEDFKAGKYAYSVGCYKKQHLYISLTDTENKTLLDKQIIEYGWSDATKNTGTQREQYLTYLNYHFDRVNYYNDNEHYNKLKNLLKYLFQ